MYDSFSYDSPPLLPELIPFVGFSDAAGAVQRLVEIYERNTAFIRGAFDDYIAGRLPAGQRVRAYYPAIRIKVRTYQGVDSRLSYGHVVEPGTYMTTVTQPVLYADYLKEQIGLLLRNHSVPVEIGESSLAIPLHFSFTDGNYVEATYSDAHGDALRDHFDVPDLAVTDDAIVNGTWQPRPGEPMPLAPFTAPRVDYSLHRLQHYTATAPQHFQNFVLFTNYQFYVDAFCQWARETLAQGEGGYLALVEPGNVVTPRGADAERSGQDPARIPQMPSYHLVRENHSGITLINIGVGPSNAKTITDHVAVLRPSAWLMLGHCAGLRTTQRLGDYVLAHGYVREDHVLDADLPTWVPVPPLAEIQVALEQAVAEVALRRLDSGLWGDSMCEVVTARKQFAPTLVAPGFRLRNNDAWAEAVGVAFAAERNWALPAGERQEIVPGASHFAAHAIASPSWRNAYQVATIGGHTFYKVQSLKPRQS